MAKSNRSIDEKFNQPFAVKIRSLMDEQGITQDKLSKEINRTRQTVSQYVNGISEPSYGTLVKIADFFNVSIDYLLGRTKTKSQDATVLSVIEYTGLSEDNVKTLHGIAEAAGGQIISNEDENTIFIDGNKPFLDCLNDLLDALYFDRNVIAKHYIRLRRSTLKNDAVDFWYSDDSYGEKMHGLEPSKYRDMKLQLKYDNELVEYDCMKIAEKIEEYLMEKYVATSDEIEDLKGQIDSIYGKYKSLPNQRKNAIMDGTTMADM